MFGLGATELIIIAIIVLLFFGAKRLPEIGQGLGKAISEFRKVGKNSQEDGEDEAGKENKSEAADYIEKKVKDKVVDSVPGIKQVRELKDKAEKIKSIVN